MIPAVTEAVMMMMTDFDCIMGRFIHRSFLSYTTLITGFFHHPTPVVDIFSAVLVVKIAPKMIVQMEK